MNERINQTVFEELYVKVREKEHRLYSDKEVSELPFVKKEHPHFDEWAIRKYSFEKLIKYLSAKKKSFHILDIGCGNGWMTDKLSEINNSTVTGIDANNYEIEQAQRVFKNNKKIRFVYSNLLENALSDIEKIDIIILAASVQYFPDLNFLIKNLLVLLDSEGEIHIIDSSFYAKNNIETAKAASSNYYKNLDYPAMAKYYHHHLWSVLQNFNFKTKNRSLIEKLFLQLFKTKNNYFPWIVIKKNQIS